MTASRTLAVSLVDRYKTPKIHDIRYVDDRLSAILRELSRFRSSNVAYSAFEHVGRVDCDDEGVLEHFDYCLKLAEAYYRQFRLSDETVAALPLYYGSMWLARAILSLYERPQDLGKGLKTHGMATKFLDIEDIDLDETPDALEEIIKAARVQVHDDGRLTMLSQVLGGDDLSGKNFGLGELLMAVPELTDFQECRHPYVHPREDDFGDFDKERGLFTRCGFDYRLLDASGYVIDFDREIALAPVFRARNAYVTSGQVHFDCASPGRFDELYDLTLSTPKGPFLERRLADGSYVPEMAVHLAIQHALSELVRYHAMTWLRMVDANTEECVLVRNFMEISSRKFPHLVLNELAWSTYDFRYV